MRWLCIEVNLRASAKSWKMTTLLFSIIYLIPLGVSYCVAALIRPAAAESFKIELGPAGLLLLPVFFASMIPMIHLFMSISRMKNEAQATLTR